MKRELKLGIAGILLMASIGIGVRVMQIPRVASFNDLAPLRSTSRTTEAHPPLVAKPKSHLLKWQPLLDDSLTWQERLALTDEIREGITTQEISFLFAALDHQPLGATEEQWWVVMNEIMDRMRKHGLGADQYSIRIGKIAGDSKRPEVVRDYAIQHLLQWVSSANPQVFPSEADPLQRKESLELVTRIIRDPSLRHSSIPGTSLLALAHASARLPLEEVTPLWDALDSYLSPLCTGGSDASLGLHISAIQTAALMGRTCHLPAIRNLAMNEAADPSLRLTSIAALGIYHAEDSRDFLESISRDGGRLSYAAKSSLDRLNHHLTGSAK